MEVYPAAFRRSGGICHSRNLHLLRNVSERTSIHKTLERRQRHVLLEVAVLLEGREQFPQPMASKLPAVARRRQPGERGSQSGLKLALGRQATMKCTLQRRVEELRLRIQMRPQIAGASGQLGVFHPGIGREKHQNLLETPVFLPEIVRNARTIDSARVRCRRRDTILCRDLAGTDRARALPPSPIIDAHLPLVTVGA
jgi:hypothetical protein